VIETINGMSVRAIVILTLEKNVRKIVV
jgi:hypothetical protein